MAKKLGVGIMFLGAFLLVLAVMSKYYMYDRLAVVPDNNETTSISATAPGADAEYLNAAAGLKITDGPLKSTRIVQGDVDASKKASKELGRDVAVWKTFSCTAAPDFNCGGGDTPLSATSDVVAFDAKTGEAVNWSGAKSETGGETIQPANFTGQYFKFPFDTQKKTYQFWDGTLRKATPAVFKGEAKIDGLKVYKFQQVIDPVKTGTIDVPGTLVGSDEGTVTADQFYSNVRSFSVEPVTGVIIVGGEAQDGYLELDGERVLTTTKATLQYTDENTKETVDTYKPKAQLLSAVKTTFPLVGGIVGILLLAAGVFLRVRRNDRSDRGVHADA